MSSQPSSVTACAYADLQRINIHGEEDRKDGNGVWIKTWKERLPGKTISHHTRASGLWGKISARCLVGGQYQRGNSAYLGTTNEFSDFQQFAEWCSQQPGYSSFDDKGFRFEIDKDILIRGNKVYSPESCCFVPKKINSLLTASNSTRGEFPIGVSYVKNRRSFMAYCNSHGVMKTLGYFKDSFSAHAAWQVEKAEVIRAMALEYLRAEGASDRVHAALLSRAAIIERDNACGLETLAP